MPDDVPLSEVHLKYVLEAWQLGVDDCIAELEKSLGWALHHEVRTFVTNGIAALKAMRAVGPKR